jgi:hypothetical protein
MPAINGFKVWIGEHPHLDLALIAFIVALSLVLFGRSLRNRGTRVRRTPYYRFWGPVALRVKIILQMMIGTIVAILLMMKLASHLTEVYKWLDANLGFMMDFAWRETTLTIVSKGLAYSAGLDLAYMLFTEGPDEAFDPVVLAMASGIMLLASEEKIPWENSVGIFVLAVSMGILFLVRERLYPERRRRRRRW